MRFENLSLARKILFPVLDQRFGNLWEGFGYLSLKGKICDLKIFPLRERFAIRKSSPYGKASVLDLLDQSTGAPLHLVLGVPVVGGTRPTGAPWEIREPGTAQGDMTTSIGFGGACGRGDTADSVEPGKIPKTREDPGKPG